MEPKQCSENIVKILEKRGELRTEVGIMICEVRGLEESSRIYQSSLVTYQKNCKTIVLLTEKIGMNNARIDILNHKLDYLYTQGKFIPDFLKSGIPFP